MLVQEVKVGQGRDGDGFRVSVGSEAAGQGSVKTSSYVKHDVFLTERG